MGDGTSRLLEAHAAAFAQILAATDDTDVAFRQAAALADGLFPHQVEGVAFLRAAGAPSLRTTWGSARLARRLPL